MRRGRTGVGSRTVLVFGQVLFPRVVDALDDRPLEAAGGEQVRQRGAVPERVDGEARGGRVVEVVAEPLVALDQLVDHRVDVDVRLVGHHPAARGDLEAARLHEVLERPLLRGVRLVPPQLQVADLGPDERHVLVLLHLRDDEVQNVPRVRLEVVEERLQPAGVVVREGNDDHLKRCA